MIVHQQAQYIAFYTPNSHIGVEDTIMLSSSIHTSSEPILPLERLEQRIKIWTTVPNASGGVIQTLTAPSVLW